MKKEIHCVLHGKVQMVMFRDFVQRKARRLDIEGTVKNLPDRSVEVIAQGNEDVLLKLITRLQKGPFLARVSRVDVKWREPKESYTGFTIIY